MEDLLALGIASLAGYISVLGLPQKRAAAKEKLQTVASNFAKVCSTWHGRLSACCMGGRSTEIPPKSMCISEMGPLQPTDFAACQRLRPAHGVSWQDIVHHLLFQRQLEILILMILMMHAVWS